MIGRQPAPVHRQSGTGNPLGVIGGEKGAGSADITGYTEARQQSLLLTLLDLLGREVILNRRFDIAGADRVGRDTVLAEFHRRIPRHVEDSRLGGWVGGTSAATESMDGGDVDDAPGPRLF